MRTHRQTFSCVLIGLGLTGGCSTRSLGGSAPDVVVSSAGSGATDTSAANTAGLGANANPDPIANGASSPPPVKDTCDASLPFKGAGCPCRTGDTTSCWTGPANKRNSGACHDGTQHCVGTNEFASWGTCEGQELNCPDPPPPPTDKCGCVPGAVIECDEDCSVSIFCSLTAQKTCLPDGTWAPCRETSPNAATALLADGGLNAFLGQLGPDGGLGAALSAITGDGGLDSGPNGLTAGVFSFDGKCRNVFHGCSASFFQSEQYAGDCSAAFTCGHAPTAPE